MGYLQLVICACVIVQAYGHATVDSHLQEKVKELLDSVINKEYNANLRPYGVNGTHATLVTIQLKEVNVLSVDDQAGTVTFQAYYRQEWVDSRLAYNDTGVGYIPIRDCKTVWYPDLFFLNGVDSLTGFGKPSRVMKIYPDGRVFYSSRLTQTISCNYLYKDMKEIVCPTSISSYGYLSDDIQVAFKDQGLQAARNVLLPKYTFGGVTSQTCDGTIRNARTHDDTDAFTHSCVGMDLKFTRN